MSQLTLPHQAEIEQASAWIQDLRSSVHEVLVGQENLLQGLLIGLLTGGHVLLEGVPGLAKTLAVSSLAKSLDGSFARLQFTPDLLPSDLVGTEIYNAKEASFTVRRGPLFANFVLADEVNRAPAKVQSALLEAMQERQVSIGGQTYPLPRPFLVLATQNPLEQEGTYPLPEAQLDRFMFKVFVDYPSHDEELGIMRSVTGSGTPQIKPVLTQEEILRLQDLVRRVPVADHVFQYAATLVRSTRPNSKEASSFIKNWVSWGAGPRASLNLIIASKARAILRGRFNVAVEDVQALALPVLRHRIGLNFAAHSEGVNTDKVVQQLLETIPTGGALYNGSATPAKAG